MDIFKSLDNLQFLQILNLSNNKIKELPELNLTALRELNLETNMIKTAAEFKGLPSLKKLNLKQNKLSDCHGLANCPELDVLYLVKKYQINRKNILIKLKIDINLINLSRLKTT